MSKRFIIPEQDLIKKDDVIQITGESVNHIFALRHEVGDKIQINEYEVTITAITKKIIDVKIEGLAKKYGVPTKNITLIQGYLKSDKMEWVVQKAVELGASEVLAVQMQNSVVKLDERDLIKKEQRLQKIAKEAVEQCGRTDEVSVAVHRDLNELNFSRFEKIYLCHEKSMNPLIESIQIETTTNIAVVVGPEGGLDERDIAKIQGANTIIVSLGERILRAETASVYMLSIIDFLCS